MADSGLQFNLATSGLSILCFYLYALKVMAERALAAERAFCRAERNSAAASAAETMRFALEVVGKEMGTNIE